MSINKINVNTDLKESSHCEEKLPASRGISTPTPILHPQTCFLIQKNGKSFLLLPSPSDLSQINQSSVSSNQIQHPIIDKTNQRCLIEQSLLNTTTANESALSQELNSQISNPRKEDSSYVRSSASSKTSEEDFLTIKKPVRTYKSYKAKYSRPDSSIDHLASKQFDSSMKDDKDIKVTKDKIKEGCLVKKSVVSEYIPDTHYSKHVESHSSDFKNEKWSRNLSIKYFSDDSGDSCSSSINKRQNVKKTKVSLKDEALYSESNIFFQSPDRKPHKKSCISNNVGVPFITYAQTIENNDSETKWISPLQRDLKKRQVDADGKRNCPNTDLNTRQDRNNFRHKPEKHDDNKKQGNSPKKITLSEYRATKRHAITDTTQATISHLPSENKRLGISCMNKSEPSDLSNESDDNASSIGSQKEQMVICTSCNRTNLANDDQCTFCLNKNASDNSSGFHSDELMQNVMRKVTELDVSLKRGKLGQYLSSISKKAFYGPPSSQKCSLPQEEDANEEPTVLTISSDEETDSISKYNSGISKFPTESSGSSLESYQTVSSGKAVSGDENSRQSSKKELDEDFIGFPCTSILIGSYHVVPQEVALISRGCITLVVPTMVEGDDPAILVLKSRGLMAVLAHLEGDRPILVLHLKPTAASYVRRLLKMVDIDGPYFDPLSSDDQLKRILIMPQYIKFYHKHSIVSFLKEDLEMKNPPLFEMISADKANDIVYKSCPAQEVQSNFRPIRMKSTRLFVFPFDKSAGGITVTSDDYCCLEEEQYLNDVIIDFYLTWLLLNKLKKSDLDRTHLFSTFFYKRLTSKPKRGRRIPSSEDDPRLTPAQKRHSRVKSWTKNVDLFAKDFILIPINEHSHWFLAVICFPGKVGDPVAVHRPAPSKKYEATLRGPQKIEEMPPFLDDLVFSDRDEAVGEEDEFESYESEDSAREATPQPPVDIWGLGGDPEGEFPQSMEPPIMRSKKEGSDEIVKRPCILLFDSLRGPPRANIVSTLREYLSEEVKSRKGALVEFSRDTIPGAHPKVPQQTNLTDCGLYTLQFAESFFDRPLKNFSFPIRSLREWFNVDVIASKREFIADLIKDLTNQFNFTENISLPTLYFNPHKTLSFKYKGRKERIVDRFDSVSVNSSASLNDAFCVQSDSSVEMVGSGTYSSVVSVAIGGSANSVNRSLSSIISIQSVISDESLDMKYLKRDKSSLVNNESCDSLLKFQNILAQSKTLDSSSEVLNDKSLSSSSSSRDVLKEFDRPNNSKSFGSNKFNISEDYNPIVESPLSEGDIRSVLYHENLLTVNPRVSGTDTKMHPPRSEIKSPKIIKSNKKRSLTSIMNHKEFHQNYPLINLCSSTKKTRKIRQSSPLPGLVLIKPSKVPDESRPPSSSSMYIQSDNDW